MPRQIPEPAITKDMTHVPHRRYSVDDIRDIAKGRRIRLQNVPVLTNEDRGTCLVLLSARLPINGSPLQARDAAGKLIGDWTDTATVYRVRLCFDGRTMDTDYSTGWSHLMPPTLEDVLDSLLSSTRDVADRTFEDWCADFGYDTDSRAAEKTFNACRDLRPHVVRLLGNRYDELAALTDERDLADALGVTPIVRLAYMPIT